MNTENIVKVQRRNITSFVTIPKKYADKMNDSTHMKVRENDCGNLEYEPIKKKEVDQDDER